MTFFYCIKEKDRSYSVLKDFSHSFILFLPWPWIFCPFSEKSNQPNTVPAAALNTTVSKFLFLAFIAQRYKEDNKFARLAIFE